MHALSVPEIVGRALIVTLAVFAHPRLFRYVIVTVPAVTAVTKPVEETVAMPVFEEVHGVVAAGVPEPVN